MRHPIIVEFDTMDKENNVNITTKHRLCFVTIKTLDPLVKIITQLDTVINQKDEFTVNIAFAESIIIINDRTSYNLTYIVHHSINSRNILNMMKFGDISIMEILK